MAAMFVTEYNGVPIGVSSRKDTAEKLAEIARNFVQKENEKYGRTIPKDHYDYDPSLGIRVHETPDLFDYGPDWICEADLPAWMRGEV